MKKNTQEVSVRSSAAEYLTFIASTGSGQQSIEVRYEDENIWLTQKMLATLYEVEVNTINYHIKKIFEDGELAEASVIRNFRITATDGKSYNTKHYALQEAFFKKVQNKLHWAIHKHTAAELIAARANADKENMGLTSWAEAPQGKIRKSDVVVAKNYLAAEELKALELLVSGYLDFAEGMAKRRIPMTMQDWAAQLDQILVANKYELLQNAGKISMDIAKQHAETEWGKYRVVQDRLFHSDFDRFLQLENSIQQVNPKA